MDAATVDEYLEQVEPRTRAVLHRLRKQILAAAPGAQERISYRIPTFMLHGRPLLHFAMQPRHLAIYGPSLQTLERFRKELAPFDVQGRTIRFTADNPVPAGLVKRLVKSCVEEAQAGAARNGGAPKATPVKKKPRSRR